MPSGTNQLKFSYKVSVHVSNIQVSFPQVLLLPWTHVRLHYSNVLRLPYCGLHSVLYWAKAAF